MSFVSGMNISSQRYATALKSRWGFLYSYRENDSRKRRI